MRYLKFYSSRLVTDQSRVTLHIWRQLFTIFLPLNFSRNVENTLRKLTILKCVKSDWCQASLRTCESQIIYFSPLVTKVTADQWLNIDLWNKICSLTPKILVFDVFSNENSTSEISFDFVRNKSNLSPKFYCRNFKWYKSFFLNWCN